MRTKSTLMGVQRVEHFFLRVEILQRAFKVFLFLGLLFAFSADLKAQATYDLITSNTDLIAGEKYLIVGKNGANYYAMSNQATNNRPGVLVSVSANSTTVTVATSSADVINPYEVTLGGSTGDWTLYDAVNTTYLKPRTGSNNGLQGQAGTSSAKWTTISVNGSGVADMRCENTTTYPRNILRFNYNSGSPIMACYASGQTDVYLFKKQSSATPSILLANNGTQIAADNVEQGTASHILSTFKLEVSDADAKLDEAYFTTSGNYTSTDVTNFKLWANSSNNFATASAIGTPYSSASSGSGDLLEFTSLSYNISENATAYLWVTADVSGSATTGRTINVDAIAGADFVFDDGTATGSASSAGAQTIILSTAPDLWVESETDLDFGSICINTSAPTDGSFELYGVNLAGANVTVASLSGFTFSTDGSTFSSSLNIPIVAGEVLEEITVRFTPAAVQSYSDDIIISTTGVSNVEVAVTGAGAGAPSITTQPADKTVVVGNTATFSVSATGSYQWQVDDGTGWANVSSGTGGTTDSYTTDVTTTGMDGYFYRVKVTNSCGTTESNGAKLTVTLAVVFEKIDDINDLVDGEYIIAYGSTVAMNNTYTTYLDKTAISPVSDQIINPDPEIVWEISTDAGHRTIYNADADFYLSYTGSSNNIQVKSSVTDDHERWDITYSGGKFLVTNTSVTSRRLQYNTSSPRFACYTSGQQDLTLYRKIEDLGPAPEIAVSQGVDALEDGSGSYDFGSQLVSTSSGAVTFTISNPGTDDLTLGTITLSGAGATNFSVSQPVSATVVEAGSTTFTVTFTPASIGLKTATVNIPNNVGDDYTFTVKGTGVYSSSSDMVEDASFTYTSNIDYLTYQSATISNTGTGANGSVGVMRFIVRDGGASANDTDALSTTLTDINFSYTGAANTVRAAALFSGNTLLASGTVGASSISFSGLSIVAADDDMSAAITLRVTFTTTVTDNDQLQFAVSSAVADVTGSVFATGNAGAAASSTTGDRNRIEVVADRIGIVQQATTTAINNNMTPAVTVEGKDGNNNRDLDYTGSISISSTGTLTGSPVAANAVNGVATFATLVHTVAGTGYALTANSSGLAFSNTATSTAFDITTIVYVNGDYRTTGSGNWVNNNATPAIWERYNSGAWTASNSPNYNTSNAVYIQNGHSITTGGSFGNNVVLNIMQGGTFTSGHSATVASVMVDDGGTLNVNAAFTVASTGILEVKNGGTLNYNRSSGNPFTSLFAGTENFHPTSNFTVKNWDDGYELMSSVVSTNTYNGYTAAFGNITIDINNSNNNITLIASGISANLAHGDLHFLAYNQTTIRLSTTGTVTSGIGGDFIVDDTYTGANAINMKTSGTLDFTIGGDMQLDAATTRIQASSTATSIVTIMGNLNITPSAVLDFNSTVAAGATSTLNLMGDLTAIGSGLLMNNNSSNLGTLNFTAAGDGVSNATTQTIDIATTGTNENKYINFTVNDGAYVRLINRDLELGTNSKVIVQGGGTLDFGFDGATALNVAISGSQTGTGFTAQQGSTLKITSPDGIASSGSVGNVQTVASNRTFSSLATYHYIGKDHQQTGSGLPAASSGKLVIVEMDNNNLTLTPTQDFQISNNTTLDVDGGKLEIRKGIFVDSPSSGVSGGSGRLVMTDGTFRSSVVSTTLPRLTNYAKYALTGGTVELNGVGDQTLSGAPNGGYYNLAVTNSGTKDITSGFQIANNLLITDGVLEFSNKTVNGEAGITMTGGRLRLSRVSATLPELLGNATPYTLSGGTIELYGTTDAQSHSIRGTYGANSSTINYYNIDLNAAVANVGMGSSNVIAGAGFGVQGVMNINAPTCFRLVSTYIINGTGTFDLQPGATFKYGGSIMASGAVGNIQTAVRNFPSTASYGFVGSNTPQVAGDGLPASVVNLYMDKWDAPTKVVELASNINVNGNLQFYQGILKSDNNTVSIAIGGDVLGAGASAGWVNGNLERNFAVATPSASFEVGTADYSPVSMLFDNLSTIGTMKVRARTPDHTQLSSSLINPSKSVNRYWTVSQSGMVMGSYTPTFNFVGSDLDAGTSTAALYVGLYSNGWTYPLTGTHTSSSTQALAVTSYGDFALGEHGSPSGNPPANDNPKSNNPSLNNVSFYYPNCFQVTGTTTEATVNANTGLRDVWYQFNATSSAVSIRVSSTVFDAKVFLFDSALNLLNTEDMVSGLGTEILNYDGLTAGATYRIAIASNDATDGEFKICLQNLRAPGCDNSANQWGLCSLYKSKSVGATTTTFSFTDGDDNTVQTTVSSASILLNTIALGLRHNTTYTLDLTANYHLQDGAGNPEVIQVYAPAPCTVPITQHQLVEMRASDRCANNAVHLRNGRLWGSFMSSGAICGLTSFRIEFTPVDNCAGDGANPLETFSKPTNITQPYIDLNYAMNGLPTGLSGTGYWSVRWRPRFNGYEGTYGPAHVVAINGTSMNSGMVSEQGTPIHSLTDLHATVYPNPNSGEMVNLNMTGITSGQVGVRIMDATGRVIFTNTYAVDGSLNTIVNFDQQLAQGLYMVEFTDGNQTQTQRMMVTK